MTRNVTVEGNLTRLHAGFHSLETDRIEDIASNDSSIVAFVFCRHHMLATEPLLNIGVICGTVP
jgi:hypothetical protein